MKKFSVSILLVSLLFSAGYATAETIVTDPDSGAVASQHAVNYATWQDPGLPGKNGYSYPKNNIKLNLSSLVLNNYSLSYERSLTRKISFVAGYRFMPKTVIGSMKIAEALVENMDVGSDIRNNLDNFTSSNKAYTGEIRFYSGKKPGARGLYLSLYGRYTDMRYDIDVDYSYGSGADQKDYHIPIRSQVAGFGGGMMVGWQWLIAKRVVLDWYILGGHYGKLTKGNFEGFAKIDPENQAQVKEEIEALGTIGSTKYIEATVNDNGVKATVNGPFLGVRSVGINLGIAF